MAAGKEYNVEKRERGSHIIFPVILRLLGKISGGEDGKGTVSLRKKIKIEQKWGWGRTSSITLYTPALFTLKGEDPVTSTPSCFRLESPMLKVRSIYRLMNKSIDQ